MTGRTRRYLPSTSILITEVACPSGRVRITESVNSGVAGRLPSTELARRVEDLAGEVTPDWSFQPGHGLTSWSPWTEQIEDLHVVHAGQLVLAAVAPHDLGLMAEMRAPHGGPVTGNFPALSNLAHLTSIRAVHSRLGG